MLTARTSHSVRAASMRLSCPACSAPMVGTRPMFFRDSRNSRTSLTLCTARTYILDVGARRGKDLISELRVPLGEWRRRIGPSERSVANEDLTIRVRTSPDSNRRNLQAGGHPSCKVDWNGFEHDGKHAGLFQNLSVLHQPFRCSGVSAL